MWIFFSFAVISLYLIGKENIACYTIALFYGIYDAFDHVLCLGEKDEISFGTHHVLYDRLFTWHRHYLSYLRSDASLVQ